MRLGPAFPQKARKKSTLRIALLVSVLIHAAVLLWVRFDPSESAPSIEVPTIELRLIAKPPDEEPADEEEPDPDPMPAPLERDIPPDLPEQAEQTVATALIEPANDEPEESSVPIDWENVISTIAEESTIQNIEQERIRNLMWRKTFSVMFAPPEEWLIEDQPFLPDLQFEADKPKRLGIKISENCYLGFPGIDPQTVDSDVPAWSGGGVSPAAADLITCGFGG